MTTDYQNFTNRNTSLAERRRLNVGDVWSNAVKCTKCNDVIRSKNRHDYVECSCGSIAVDGGSWYCKRVGDINAYQDLSESFYDLPEENII